MPETQPERSEHPAVATGIRVARIAPQASRRTTELRLQRGDGAAHPLTAGIDRRERPCKPQKRDVERRIAE